MKLFSRHLFPSPSGFLPALFIASVILTAVFSEELSPYPRDYRSAAPFAPPSASHPLGTDESGRDILTVMIHGSRLAVIAGFGTVLFSLIAGFLVGSAAGLSGRAVDEILMRITEVFLAFPGILLAIFIMFLTQNPSPFNVVLALSATSWAPYARLARGQVIALKNLDFIEAARSYGASRARILFVHMMPNLAAPLTVQAAFGIGGAILSEASLSYLGLSPAGASSWGSVMEQGAALFVISPYPALAAGSAIFLTVLSANLIGDNLRDRLDPSMKAGI